jgi:hypothetical protein
MGAFLQRYSLLAIFLLNFQLGQAQSEIESLKARLKSSKKDTDRVKIINQLSAISGKQFYEEGIDYAVDALNL